MVLNGAGALATGVVGVIVVLTKFTQGAWLVIVAIPLMVGLFLGINRHYRKTARRLRAAAAAVASAPPARTTTVVNVRAIDAATERAVWYARSTFPRGACAGASRRWRQRPLAPRERERACP